MPQQSRYANDEFEALMNRVLYILDDNNADRDLSLMVLGNAITHIINTQVPAAQREAMAEQFASVLKKSITK
ncbi:DUF1414 domain-containing protein [Alteromonas sp. CYL-A6]|uniref:DUF1414 domain-containing protein n=1 Tax=Alteromonas nitratireducens TaxID=3390813 RepID=UPI0034BB8A38